MTRTFVLHPAIRGGKPEAAAARLAEGLALTRALALELAGGELVWLARPHPATYIGPGKVEEIGARIAAEEIALVIVNGPLSPVQQRNLERAWKAKVLDRTGLILEIFGERAQTREGVLQVDLAHLEYQKSRLVRSWTHLERQRGGAGFMGGPGERQIESDRRQIDEKITRLRRQLEKVVNTRTLHRKALGWGLGVSGTIVAYRPPSDNNRPRPGPAERRRSSSSASGRSVGSTDFPART